MSLPMIHTIGECQHCGSRSGFYVKVRISGTTVYNYSFDGSIADNSNMLGPLRHKDGKYAYCTDCDKTLGRWNEESKSIVQGRRS